MAWLRRRIEERLFLARNAIEVGNAAVWHEQSSGVLVTGEGTETDCWQGFWAMGDSSLTRLMEANDPQDTIARCEAELAILDLHAPVCPLAEMIVDWREWQECRECGPNKEYPEYLHQPGRGEKFYPCRTVRLLASGYRHRPGFPTAFAAES